VRRLSAADHRSARQLDSTIGRAMGQTRSTLCVEVTVVRPANFTPILTARQRTTILAKESLRTTRRQSLTDAGRVFYERAKNILTELEAAEALLAETRSIPRGRLRISAPITFGSHALVPEIPEYLRHHPEVSVELSLTNRTVDLIDEGFDVVFRTGELPDSGLLARRLAPHRLVLCAAPDYLKSAGKLRKPEDLKHHECLVFSHTSMRTQWSFDGPRGRVSVPIAGRFLTDSRRR